MRKRRTSDEAYILGLCDRLLNSTHQAQATFDDLRGDPNAKGRRALLPVDGYYEDRNLVIEYHERQHIAAVPHLINASLSVADLTARV